MMLRRRPRTTTTSELLRTAEQALFNEDARELSDRAGDRLLEYAREDGFDNVDEWRLWKLLENRRERHLAAARVADETLSQPIHGMPQPRHGLRRIPSGNVRLDRTVDLTPGIVGITLSSSARIGRTFADTLAPSQDFQSASEVSDRRDQVLKGLARVSSLVESGHRLLADAIRLLDEIQHIDAAISIDEDRLPPRSPSGHEDSLAVAGDEAATSSSGATTVGDTPDGAGKTPPAPSDSPTGAHA